MGGVHVHAAVVYVHMGIADALVLDDVHGMGSFRLLVILNPPLVVPVEVGHLPVEAEGEPDIVGLAGVGLLQGGDQRTCRGALLGSGIVPKGIGEGLLVQLVGHVHAVRQPAVGAGNVEILLARHLEDAGDLTVEGGATVGIKKNTDHWVTVTGIKKDRFTGEVLGVHVQDTGGWNRVDNNIFIPLEKFNKMRKISSDFTGIAVFK